MACTEDVKRAEEIANKNIVGYYWSVMEHYEMTGDHFADTGKSYAHYAAAAKQMKDAGMDAMVKEFIEVNLWGTPDMIVEKLRKRREVIGDFEVNGSFSYHSLPYDEVEKCMRLFARTAGQEIHSWTPKTSQVPVDVAPSATIQAK